jgi:hypothetical protein
MRIKLFASALLTASVMAVSSAHADALGDFKTIAANCRKVLDARPRTEVVYIEITKQWVRRLRAPVTIRIDVKKTDSLTSPYTGKIEIEELTNAERGVDEQSAAATQPSLVTKGALQQVNKINFVFREDSGEWEAIDGSIERRTRIADGGDFGAPRQYDFPAADFVKYEFLTKTCLNLK